jgi:hypothetical protein
MIFKDIFYTIIHFENLEKSIYFDDPVCKEIIPLG